MEDMLAVAISYADRGWIVHALTSPTSGGKSPGKRPIDLEWQLATTPPTKDRLVQWFGSGNPKGYNLGLRCGEASGVTVIDLDRGIYADIFNGVDTLRSSRTTGRGHVFFKYNPSLPSSRHHNIGIEVLSESRSPGKGTNIVLPPSAHVSGDVYQWDDPTAPLAEMPDDVELKLKNLFEREKTLNALIRKCRPCFAKLWKTEVRVKTDFHGGEGRELMVAWGAELKAAGATLADAEMWAKIIYGEDHDHAKTLSEWRTIDPARTWKCATIAEKLSGVIECECDTCHYHPPTQPRQQTPAATTAQIAKAQHDASPDTFLGGDRNTFDPNTFAKWLLNDSGFTFATLSDTDEVLRYDGGVYLNGGDVEIKEIIERVMDGFKVSKFNVNEVIGHIQRRTYAKREDFDVDPNIINLDNGRFDFETMEFKPHTTEYLSLHKSPIVYDPDARCEQVERFFSEVLQEHDVAFMYELFGYALLKEKRMQAAVIMEGEGRTGKSTMIELFEAFVGSNLCSHITPTELSGDDRFAASDLYGMLLNMVDDLGDTPLKNLGTFKSVVSNKKIRGQEKNRAAFDFVPYVLCVFACNEVPMTYDTSDAFFRRMMIVSFLQKFEGRRDTETTKADNPRIINDLTSRGEISGLFNSAIQAAKAMLERGSFTGVKSIDERKMAYLYASNPVARFVDELCDVTDPDALIGKEELYQAFILWCRDGGIRVVDKGRMTVYLAGLGCVVTRPHDGDGGRYMAYTGVNIKSVGRCGKCGDELCGETFRGAAGLGLICADCQAELDRSPKYGRVEQGAQITDTVNRLGRDSPKHEFTVVNVLMELPKRQGFTTEKIEVFMNEHARDLKIKRVGGGVWGSA